MEESSTVRKLSSLRLPNLEIAGSKAATVLIGELGQQWLKHVSSRLSTQKILAGSVQVRLSVSKILDFH